MPCINTNKIRRDASLVEAVLEQVIASHDATGCRIVVGIHGDSRVVGSAGIWSEETSNFDTPIFSAGAQKSMVGTLRCVLSEPITPQALRRIGDAAELIGASLPPEDLPADDEIRYLKEALMVLPEPVAVFDDRGCFLLWNKHFEATYSRPGAEVRRGLSFAQHLRNCLDIGMVISARGQESEWLASRLDRFEKADSYHEHQLSSGKWVRVQDRPLPSGGRIGLRMDITQLVEGGKAFRALFDSNPVPMYLINQDTLRFEAVNDAALSFYGYSRDEFLKLTLRDIRPEQSAGEINSVLQSWDELAFSEVPRFHYTSGGDLRVVRVSLKSIEHQGSPVLLAAVFDITRQHKAEDDLLRARELLKNIVDFVPTALFAKDMHADGRYVFYNRAAEAIFGRSAADIIGRTTHESFPAAEAAVFCEQDAAAMKAGTSGTIDEAAVRRGDEIRWIRTRKVGLADDATSKPRYVLGVAEDFTEQKSREAAFAYRADHDPMTGLANRAKFLSETTRELQTASAFHMPLAVHYIDLDGFKPVNDTFGHAVGDALLQMVADRLRSSASECCLAARLGGDEFAVLQLRASNAEAANLAQDIVRTLSLPFLIGGRVISIGASVGVAYAPCHGNDVLVLLEQADRALYQAKNEGKGGFVIRHLAS